MIEGFLVFIVSLFLLIGFLESVFEFEWFFKGNLKI